MINRPMYVNKIMAFTDTPFVKILTGIRRSGKSTILNLIIEELKNRGIADENIICYRFDSMENINMTANEFFSSIKTKLSPDKKNYLFLDEVQEIPNWERVVNTLASEYNTDIYVTGSNSRMMSSEISTYLTGRYVAFNIFTLSFQEYLNFREEFTNISSPKDELGNYIRLGGFPATHLREYSDDEVYTIVKDIYNSTIFSDIVKRNELRKIDQLERIVMFAFDNVGKTFSAKSISDYLKSEYRKIDNETVYNYLEKLESAYILHRCSRYDIKGKELLKTQEKFYLSDISLLYATMGYKDTLISGVLENIVFLELKRRGYNVFIGKLDSKEIDFIAEKADKKIYIQVAYKLENPETIEREFSVLLSINDQYPKYVVTMDDFWNESIQGIHHCHIADFLLDNSY